jgi:hypothetical protein
MSIVMKFGAHLRESLARRTLAPRCYAPHPPHESYACARAAARLLLIAMTRLSRMKLQGVANGLAPPSVARIIDVDLSDSPELPVDHRDYERRHQHRIKVLAENRANAIRRQQLTLEAWTDLYTLYAASTEVTAPVLHRELKQGEVRPLAVWRGRRLL